MIGEDERIYILTDGEGVGDFAHFTPVPGA